MTANTTSADATDATDTDGLDRLVRGYQFTQALHVAARLNIPDLVADGPQSAADLAGRSGAHAPSLARLLRALTTLGVPGSRRAMLMLSGSQLYAGWGTSSTPSRPARRPPGASTAWTPGNGSRSIPR